MVVLDYGGYKGYMDGYLQKNLELYKKMVKKERDLIFLGSGKEGDGKTYLVAGILRYLDPTFNIDRCYMTGDEFMRALVKAKEPYKAYMFDEGQEFTSRSAMSRFNKILVQVISKIRAKQLYIGICIPEFFELEKYCAIHRANFLLKVYTHKLKRGFFQFWNWESKKRLYLFGKKAYDYNCVTSNFRGKFTMNMFPFNKEEYKQKKFAAMENIDITKKDVITKRIGQRNVLIEYLYNVDGLTQRKIAEILSQKGYPLTREGIGEILNSRKGISPQHNTILTDKEEIAQPQT